MALHIAGAARARYPGAILVSLVVIVVARLPVRFIEQLSARDFAMAPDLKTRLPQLERRANRSLPILTGPAGAAVYVLAPPLVLQAGMFGHSPGSKPG